MKRIIDIFALILIIIGAVNWGLYGLFELDLISWLFGGQTVAINRIIYVIVAISGLWCINLVIMQSRKKPTARVNSESEV